MACDVYRADANILAHSKTNKRRESSRLKTPEGDGNKTHVIWCDKSIDNNRPDDQHTLAHLRSVYRHLIIFGEEKLLLKYIDDMERKNRLFLIISGSLGEHLVPQIHHRHEIRSIYIFCGNKSTHEVWARRFPKIKGVFDQITQLCRVLKADKQQLQDERVPKMIIDDLQDHSSSFSNFEQHSTIKDLKYSPDHPSIDNITTTILSSLPSPNSRRVEIKRNSATSNTLSSDNSHREQIEFADAGIWPCVSVIANNHDELIYYLQSAVKPATINHFDSKENFSEFFRNNLIAPHFVVLSNPENLDYVHQLVHPHVRKLYIHCSNDRLAEYYTWNEQHPQLICVLQRLELLSRLIVQDLSDCVRDLGNYYTSQNRRDLAQRRYEYAYRLRITIHDLLNHQRDRLECMQSPKSNN